MNIIAYIIINVLLFLSWYVYFFLRRDILSFVDRLIGTVVLGLAQIIATELILGVVFKQLFPVPLFTLNMAISVILLFYLFLTSRTTSPSPAADGLPAGLHAAIILELRDKSRHFFGMLKADRLLFCIFGLSAVILLWIVFQAYLFPSYTWDALWYHLPIVGYIMQSGAIQETSAPSFINQFINIFPKNVELFFLWNVIFLGSDVITDLSQALFTVLGVLVLYSIARKARLSRDIAVYSSLLFVFTPVVILQSSTNYVDVAISVLFLAAFNFLLNESTWDRRGHAEPFGRNKQIRVLTLLAGITTGILLGAKGSGPLFVLLLTGAFFIRDIWKIFHGLSEKGKTGLSQFGHSFRTYMLWFLLPVLLLGGYWYMKNWLFYGNPVYPMEISAFDVILFKGMYKGIIEPAPAVFRDLSALEKLVYVWMERVEYYFYDSRLSGFGPLWFILFLPALFLAIFSAVRTRNTTFLSLAAILVAAFLLHPRNWNTRYVIFMAGLGAVSFGMTMNYLHERKRVLKIFSLVLVCYVFFTANSPCITPNQVKKFLLLPPDERTVARLAPFNIDLHARQEYGHWIWISNNISAGDTLAYTFEPLFLSPLWNRGFSNGIVYIKADTEKEWFKELKHSDATYVLVRRHSREDTWVEKRRHLLTQMMWISGQEEKLRIEYSDDNYRIVRL